VWVWIYWVNPGVNLRSRAPTNQLSVAYRVPGVANKDYVIDGDCANCPVDTLRSPAVYANHSALPNAVLQVCLLDCKAN